MFQKIPIETRMESHIFPVTESGCWLWFGHTNYKNYGVIGIGGKQRSAHRVMYEMRFGSIPSGMCVCHKCDTPQCVNPDHLFLGTVGDNTRDMTAKGRHANQKKTHCPNGHEYTPQNTYFHPKGCRICRQCRIDRGEIGNGKLRLNRRIRRVAELLAQEGGK